MDERAKTELHLSEEQLQQITGGCGACEEDKRVKRYWEYEADLSSWLGEGAAAKGDRRTAKVHWEDAMTNSNLARLRQARIDARLGTPGHPPTPGASSSSEPPAKRPRLS
jgi:hypothetical protein